MRNLISILLMGFLCQIFLFEPSALRANTFSLKAISVEGNKRLSDGAIVNYSQLNTPDTFSSEDLDAAYSRLIETKLFSSVKFKNSNGNLLITVEEYPTVNLISFEGNKKFTDEKLLSFLTAKPRFVFSPEVLEKDVLALRKAYKNSGRISARIQSKVIKLSDNRVNVIFEVFEGDVVEIEKINFSGNRTFSDRRLRRVLGSKQAGLLRKVILRDSLIEERISLDKRLLTDFYQSRGFANFRINDVNIELSQEKDGFFITYNITEGPAFTIGKITFSTNIKDFDVSNFEEKTKLKPGKIYSPSVIQSTISNLEAVLQVKGFNFVRVKPTVTSNMKDLTLDVDLKFERGERIFIERIDISGNTATLDRVLRGQFLTVEGDPFNPREIKAAADRIRALGLFANSSVDVVPGSGSSDVIIDVRVKEKPTGSLTFGAGYSSAAGLGGIVEYGEKNFLGRGQSLSFSLKTGKDDQLYQFSFFEPMFLRNDLGLGVNLSLKDTQQQNAAYDTEDVQFQPYVVYPLGELSNVKLDYSLSQTDLSNPVNVGSIITDEVAEGKTTSSSIGYVFSFDTRTYKTEPGNGFLFKLGQKFTGLGGDKTALKTDITAIAQRFILKEDVKLTAAFEAGLMTFTTGNSRVTDRYFLSSRRMRGFEPGGIGPRECATKTCGSSNNDALGGEHFAVARFEAEFPLGLPEEYGFSGGVFYDIGNLWSLSKINSNVLYEDGAWRHAVGASLFWKTPIGPLRFNFSDVLQKEIYDRDESFDLTISTRF